MYYDDNQFERIKKCLRLILCDKGTVTRQEWHNMKNNIGFFVDSSLFFSEEQSRKLEDYFFINEVRGGLLIVNVEI